MVPVTQKLQSAISVLDNLSDDDDEADKASNKQPKHDEQQQQSRQLAAEQSTAAPLSSSKLSASNPKVQNALNVLDNLSDEG